MKVFLSWSKDRGKEIAQVLHKFLPYILQNVQPFMSDRDLRSGEEWANRLDAELDDADFGILCLTEDSIDSPWLLFEAGALVKRPKASVCGILIDGLPESHIPSPILRYQCRRFDKDGLARLVTDLNDRLDVKLPTDQVEETFEMYWPKLEAASKPASETKTENRSPDEMMLQMLDEVVTAVRRIEQSIGITKRAPNLDHFYTTDESDRDARMQSGRYMSEGTACHIYAEEQPGTVALHRLKSAKRDDHFYTCWDDEIEHAIQKSGYTKEEIAGWVFDSEDGKDGLRRVPLFRMYHEGHMDHFYTTSPQERDHATQACGYRSERNACFVFDSPQPGTVPLFRMISYAPRSP